MHKERALIGDISAPLPGLVWSVTGRFSPDPRNDNDKASNIKRRLHRLTAAPHMFEYVFAYFIV